MEILKRVAIAASLFAVIWLLWFGYSQTKQGVPLAEDKPRAMHSAPGASLNSSPQTTGDASASTPPYTYTRFGLWVAPNISPTPSAPQEPQDARFTTPVTQSASATPSPRPDVNQNANGEAERSAARDSASVNLVQEDPAPIAVGASPAQKNESDAGNQEPAKLARVNQNQDAVPLPTPSVAASVESTPLGAQAGTSFKASPEEQSLKEFVLDYIQTVESNYVPTQERFFAQQVNFYGKGVLSRPMVEASMEEYRREWPIRNWEPRGEPEFPKSLHSTNPELYEVLQPIVWTVANGSHHKHGNATLYVRIRKNDKGEFHIIQLEQRHPYSQSQKNS